jgi:outer membrane receptor protein involved in Fe transport
MKKAASLAIFLFALSALGLGLEVRGKVVSSEGRPVVGAVVLHRASGAWQQKKRDPGPAEISIPAAQYANLKGSYFLAPAVNVFLTLNNLFDESYLARPDPEAMPEPGRNFLLGISFSF